MWASASPRKRARSTMARSSAASIYGDATKEEAGKLADEGIEIGEIPWVPRHDA